MDSTLLTGTAVSYVRFSSHKQERGDSLRRQEAARDAWLARHPGVVLDTSLTLADLGVSAFRGKHRADDKTALWHLLRAVESGRVTPGTFLVVESLDRLTREELGDAFELVLGLVNRGIRIVQLSGRVHTTEAGEHGRADALAGRAVAWPRGVPTQE